MSKNIVNVIVGGGEIGSRHLQGLLKYQKLQLIYIVDPSKESLEKSIKRSQEIIHDHELIFCQDLQQLPYELDLVIVSTNANIRFQVVDKLLKTKKIKKLLLEKVLFQKADDFTKILSLIKKTQTKTWVNHSRRLVNGYQEIKSKLKNENYCSYHVYGGNWGMACNGLHFIDLFSFLSGSNIHNLEFDMIHKMFPSKRKGFIEFSGIIKGSLENNSFISLQSHSKQENDLTILILSPNHRWLITEGELSQILYSGKDNNFDIKILSLEIEYQSSLTTKIVKKLLNNEPIYLPSFEEAMTNHLCFINNGLARYNKLFNTNSDFLPIT